MNKLRFILILAIGISLRSLAAVTVTSQLSADETSVGMPVQMQVNVEGTTNVVMPDSLGIDGLDTRLTGRRVQTQIDFGSGRMVASGIYYYTILPLREGTFDIPPIEINADGRKQKTSPQKLLVQAGTAPAPRPAPALPLPPGGSAKRQRPSAPSEGRLAYAEMIVPKTSIYVGEVVPVEIRFYFSERVGFRPLQDQPQVSGEGFTVQKSSPPTQTEEAIDDANYRVLTFKTSLTAVKSGEMPLPAVEFHGVLSVPTQAPANMQSVFDSFFGGRLTDDREVNIKSSPKSIRVKALPAEGRPPNFSGAVGDFTIAASADPTKVAAGDPVTLKAAVSGRGNFDAMGEPRLLQTDGWKIYPPTSHFEKSDDVGYGGTRTFETPMVALQSQTRTPVAEFSFFDPEKEKYFTIKSQPIAIEAAADQAAPPAAVASAPSAKPSATPAPGQDDAWLASTTPRSWLPLVKTPAFLIFNGAAALVLIAVIGAISVHRSRQGPAGQRAALVRERDRLVGALGRAGLSDEAFFSKALESLAVQARLAGEAGPFELVRSLEARGRNVAELYAVLARADEIKFSGGGNATTTVGSEERRRIVGAILEAFR